MAQRRSFVAKDGSELAQSTARIVIGGELSSPAHQSDGRPGATNMIDYLMVGTNDLDRAILFYDELMREMGATKVYTVDRNVGWGWGIGTPMFIVTKPYNEQAASVGNGSMIAFRVASPEKVDQLHSKVLALGGVSDGNPGPRGEHLYVGYWRDLDGNKFNFICYRKGGEGG